MDTAQWLQLAPPGTSVPAKEFRAFIGYSDRSAGMTCVHPDGTTWQLWSTNPPHVQWYYVKLD